MSFKQVDRKADNILAALASAPVFKKQGQVKARPGVPGEQVVTKLADGSEETTNTVNEGDQVVTNPSGEEYIIDGKKFADRYEASGEEGVFNAKGCCRAVTNPFGEPVEIMASWGEPQTGDECCLFADTCDEDGSNMGGEPYLIGADEFAETYKQHS